MKKYLEIAKAVSVHGIKGEINALAWCDSPEILCRLKKLYSKDGASQFEVERARPKGSGSAIIKLKGVDSPEAAQALRNTVFYADREDMPLPRGTYFIADLIGMEVFSDGGKPLGKITDVLETGANDVYEITDGGKKFYIPAIPSVVLSTDVEGGKMTVYPMEGLFDEN